MRYRLLIWILPTLAAACDNPRPAGEQLADSITVKTDTLPWGFYEDSLPAASSPGRVVRLSISKSGEARLVTDYLNFTPEIIQIGSLQPMDSTRLQLSLVTVGTGNPVKDTMTLLQHGDTLVYTGNAYGNEGLHLVAREKPEPAPKDLVLWVKNTFECETGPGFDKTTCYEVQYGDRPAGPQAPWETLSEPIAGFNFEKGYAFKLKVTRIPKDSVLRGTGPYEFRLKEVMEKVAAK